VWKRDLYSTSTKTVMHIKETYTNLKETYICVKAICMKRPIFVEKRPPWHVNKDNYFVLEVSLKSVQIKTDVDRLKRDLYMCK